MTRAERIWCRGLRFTTAVAVMTAGLAACGKDEGRRSDAPDRTTTHAASPGEGSRQPILVRTRITGFTGTVLAGSVLGDSPFCPGGTVRHEAGSPEIGFPAVNVFRCTDGQLRIGFGPGPDQRDNAVQTSDWKVLDGTGRFAGASGHGRMSVRFTRAGASRGRETFTGRILVP
jgi:hypothetical protein